MQLNRLSLIYNVHDNYFHLKVNKKVDRMQRSTFIIWLILNRYFVYTSFDIQKACKGK